MQIPAITIGKISNSVAWDYTWHSSRSKSVVNPFALLRCAFFKNLIGICVYSRLEWNHTKGIIVQQCGGFSRSLVRSVWGKKCWPFFYFHLKLTFHTPIHTANIYCRVNGRYHNSLINVMLQSIRLNELCQKKALFFK